MQPFADLIAPLQMILSNSAGALIHVVIAMASGSSMSRPDSFTAEYNH
eukprot:SAG31_NODE_1967_length_6785_cov_7.007329_6_plen_48_part_00